MTRISQPFRRIKSHISKSPRLSLLSTPYPANAERLSGWWLSRASLTARQVVFLGFLPGLSCPEWPGLGRTCGLDASIFRMDV